MQKNEMYDWMLMAVQYPSGLMNEAFYIDTRAQEFFAICVFDYWMFDEDLEPTAGVTSNFPESEMPLLVQRIKLVEARDSSIVRVPGIPISDRAAIMKLFVDRISGYFTKRRLSRQLRNENCQGKFDFVFDERRDASIRLQWNEFRNSHCLHFIQAFCEQNHIDLSAINVYALPQKGEITLFTNNNE